MSNRRTSKLWLTIVAAALLVRVAAAQGPNYDPQTFQPFIDPLEFGYDCQPFAPYDLTEYGALGRPRTGWFATYDRMYLSMSQPSSTNPLALPENYLVPNNQLLSFSSDIYPEGSSGGNFTYGNRIDMGYMKENDRGWFVSYWKVGSPNAFQVNRAETEMIFQSDGEGEEGGGEVEGGGVEEGEEGEEEAEPTPFPVGPDEDAVFGDLQNSINAGRMWSLELNKGFRQKTLHNGLVLEPFFGFRYINFTDYFVRESILSGLGGPTSFRAAGNADNNIFGGQLGIRAHAHRGRWLLSGEARMLTAFNYQSFSERLLREESFVGEDETIRFKHEDLLLFDKHELSLASELRIEAAFQVTRDIALRGGVTVLHFSRGVARGADADNDESMNLAGVTGGLTWRR